MLGFGGSLPIQLIVDLLLLRLLLTVGQGTSLYHGILLFVKDLLLDVLVSGQRQVVLTHFLAHHFPVFLPLIEHLMVLPCPIASEACEIRSEIRT